MFVWFVFFGASYAAKMAAHNRVTFQFKFLKPRQVKYIEAIADLFWLFFNVYFVYLSINFIFNRMNRFWVSQTLDIKMKYIYLILPIAFTLMTIRIIQVSYQKLILDKEIDTPDKVDISNLQSDLTKPSSTTCQR